MKILTAKELYDHTIRFEFNERVDVEAYLNKKNVKFKNWNGGIIIVKRENGHYFGKDEIRGMGFFEVYWHGDVKRFIDCQPVHLLEDKLKSLEKMRNKINSSLAELSELKEAV